MYEGAVQDLIDELGRLPGIGPKSAQRIAFHLLAAEQVDVERLAATLIRVKNEVRFCSVCGNVAEADVCRICSDAAARPGDHLRRGGAEGRQRRRADPRVPRPLPRARRGDQPDRRRRPGRPAHPRAAHPAAATASITEIILATDPNLEGEATATYLARLIRPMGITVTRLASGLPVGGDLEYADEVTLGRAFSGRRQVE